MIRSATLILFLCTVLLQNSQGQGLPVSSRPAQRSHEVYSGQETEWAVRMGASSQFSVVFFNSNLLIVNLSVIVITSFFSDYIDHMVEKVILSCAYIPTLTIRHKLYLCDTTFPQ